MLLANCTLMSSLPRYALSTYILFLFAVILATAKILDHLLTGNTHAQQGHRTPGNHKSLSMRKDQKWT
jgi:hypothetical protein